MRDPRRDSMPSGGPPMLKRASEGVMFGSQCAPGRILRRGASRRGALALNLPIAWRLTLGFVLAGLIATLASSVVGAQRAQALAQQSSFYQSLLQINTDLSTGDSFLQLMNTKTHEIIDVASSATPSVETLTNDEQDAPRLATFYNAILKNYASHDLLTQHPDQLAILRLAGDTTAVARQTALVSSAQRTWNAYQDAQSQTLASAQAGDLSAAQTTERLAAEPTNADAQSALRALIQFNNALANSVRVAAGAQEQSLTLTTIVASLLAFLLVALVGWFISDTIIRRLRSLRAVTQAVERGQLGSRVRVIGRDEIGDVSDSVNGMLDTIVGLLEETRRQRDALSSAAERLFTDMRVASGGDLRVSASVSDDPIGLLGNAFNLTIGRFKRFISRSQGATLQLDALARQQVARSSAYIAAVQALIHSASAPPASAASAAPPTAPPASPPPLSAPLAWDAGRVSRVGSRAGAEAPLSGSLEQARELAARLVNEGVTQRARVTLEMAEQAYLSLGRLSQLTQTLTGLREPDATRQMAERLAQELRFLDGVLQRLGGAAYTLLDDETQTVERLRETLSAANQMASSPLAHPPLAPLPPGGRELREAHTYEFAQLASGYAQEVSAFARQMLVIAQEMRVNVAPFQLDTGAGGGGQEGVYPLYPGAAGAGGWGNGGAYDPAATPDRPGDWMGW